MLYAEYGFGCWFAVMLTNKISKRKDCYSMDGGRVSFQVEFVRETTLLE